MRVVSAVRRDSMDGPESRIETACERTVAWLRTMQAPGAIDGVMRISAAHDPAAWPGMLLPGTYNGAMCARLIGALDAVAPDRAALVAWLEGHRLPDGRFRIPGMRDADVFKKPDLAETWAYIDFHVTNYALGAIEALEPARAPVLDFARGLLEPLRLKAWLAERDLRDPWQEGNNVVNLGSFLLLMARHGDDAERRAVEAALGHLFAWHDRLQEPATGFWGVGQLSDPTRLLHAMAGSMHNHHLWYARGRPLPGQERAADYCLTLPPLIHSACIDVDAVDVLVHAHRLRPGYRTGAIEDWLARMLDELLAFQGADGGFADEAGPGLRRQDGWIGGYGEPQGVSNTFATFFRWIAIAMIADVLFPGRWPWAFREMVGIGYRGPAA